MAENLRRWLGAQRNFFLCFLRTHGRLSRAHAWALLVVTSLPFHPGEDVLVFNILFALTLYVVILLIYPYAMLWHSWMVAKGCRSGIIYYLSRQEEPIDYIKFAAVVSSLRLEVIVLLSPVANWVVLEFGPFPVAVSWIPFASAMLLPGLFSLLHPVPRTTVRHIFILRSGKYLIIALLIAVLRLPVLLLSPSEIVNILTLLSACLAAGTLLLVAIPLPWVSRSLLQTVAMSLWRMRFDRTPSDSVRTADWQSQGFNCLKKTHNETGDLRNAIELASGKNRITLPNGKGTIRSGLFIEDPSCYSMEQIRMRLNGRLMLDRPLSSLSEGWNDLWDMHLSATEKQWDDKATSNDLIVEIDSPKAEVFMEAPAIVHPNSDARLVLLLVVDGLRRDSLGIYGAQDVQTTNIDRFFGDSGWISDNAWSQGEWTTAVIASMFTSQYSSHHKVTNRYEGFKNSLPMTNATLAEVFQRHGWHTFYSAGSRRTSQAVGYDRGFDRVLLQAYTNMMNWNSLYPLVNELDRHRGEEIFAVLHLMDVHGPPLFWSSRRDRGGRFRTIPVCDLYRDRQPEQFDRLYKNQVEEFDLAFGILCGYLQREFGDSCAVVMTADHGQHQLAPPTDPIAGIDRMLGTRMLNVPLAVRCPWRPDLAGCRSNGLVEASVDLYPTLLEIAGLEGPSSDYARSFLPGKGEETVGKEYAVSESIYEGVVQRVIRNRDALHYERFDWRKRDKSDERVWLKNADEYIEQKGQARQSLLKQFRHVRDSRKLVGPDDDPLEYYGPLANPDR